MSWRGSAGLSTASAGERESGSRRTRSSGLPSTCFSAALASCAGLPRTNSGSLLLRDSSATGPRCAPKALEPRAKLRYLRAVEAWPAARDRAIAAAAARPGRVTCGTDSGTTDSRGTEYRKYRLPEAVRPKGYAAGRGPAKYLRLERKELLIWPDQITQCRSCACELNRSRGGAGERIEHASAVLLLSRAQDLAGTTEEELRGSLGLPD